MKVRIGYGLGTRTTTDRKRLAQLVDGLEDLDFDSIWFSERLGTDCPDPTVAMSFAMARTAELKVGMSVMVLPGRNPVVLAKTLATIDRLSDGRLLPAFGLGIADSAEQQAFGIARGDRGPWFNEALPLLRRLWTEPRVTHQGSNFTLTEVSIGPKPVQDPLEVWMGGAGPSELARVGALADGWLPSLTTPRAAAEGKKVVEAESARHGRTIDPEHFGALVAYRRAGEPLGEPMLELIKRRNPSADPEIVVPRLERVPELLAGFVEVGFSKFVLVPAVEPESWSGELETVAALVKPLET